MNIIYSNSTQSTRFHEGPVPYLTFPLLSEYTWLRHGFSTRLGGVSEGIYASMNLGFSRGDDPEAVRENFRRIGSALHILPEQMVKTDQTHTTNVMYIDEACCGMGILRERSFHDIDGFITDRPGVALVTSFADCVPVFLVDPVHHAIGSVHSGWRGTVGRISEKAVAAMTGRFGTRPADLVAFIGPSICRSCYEISEEVAEKFAESYGDEVFRGILTPEPADRLLPYDPVTNAVPGHYLLDLWKANEANLLHAGLNPEHIGITDLCTCCNPALLHSHRATKGQRGTLCGFLMIEE